MALLCRDHQKLVLEERLREVDDGRALGRGAEGPGHDIRRAMHDVSHHAGPVGVVLAHVGAVVRVVDKVDDVSAGSVSHVTMVLSRDLL